MTSKKKIIGITVMILALAAAAWWFFRQRAKKATGIQGDNASPSGQSPPLPAAGNSANQGTRPTAAPGDFPLTVGSKNKYVKALQQLLKEKGQNIAVDGSFGPKTKAALTRVFHIYSVKDLAAFNNLFGSAAAASKRVIGNGPMGS